ncbi:MAG TPA: fatty acid desaturase [Vicinamibacterales bacterium]|nr:fatty acid desaturase [Vicinamibacterales bacterium]
MDISMHAPSASALTHLRPSNARGNAVFVAGTSVTVLAIWLSLAGGWAGWIAGQTMLAIVLVHWFTVLHECGHRTLFRSRRANTIVGVVAGFLAMIPYRVWVRVHGRHHKWTGWQDLDPTAESLVPRELSRIERIVLNVCWRFWIPLFATMYRSENYWRPDRLARMFPRREDKAAMLRNGVLQLLGYAAIVLLVDPFTLARAVAAGIVLSFIIEDILLLSQHAHVPMNHSDGERVPPVPAVAQEVFTRSLRLPAWASNVLLHFDAHELHHMYPFVPGHHLRKIPYQPAHEVSWLEWVRVSKQIPGATLLFQNRHDTGIEI